MGKRRLVRIRLTAPYGANPVTIHSVFDSEGRRIAEYNEATGALIREYVWMGWEPVAVIEGGVVYYIRADHIGRPVFATNASGAKVWSVTYTPFGGVHTSSGLPIEARFPGQWYQAESGLHQNWMRDYDPTTGRYIQADPLGLVDGASVYGYALQNPATFFDPFGEEVEDASNGSGRPEKPKKYVKPKNPNQRKGADERTKSGGRERNVGHPDGEEHSRRPKGGFRLRLPFLFFMIDPILTNPCGPFHVGPCVLACTGDEDGMSFKIAGG